MIVARHGLHAPTAVGRSFRGLGDLGCCAEICRTYQPLAPISARSSGTPARSSAASCRRDRPQPDQIRGRRLTTTRSHPSRAAAAAMASLMDGPTSTSRSSVRQPRCASSTAPLRAGRAGGGKNRTRPSRRRAPEREPGCRARFLEGLPGTDERAHSTCRPAAGTGGATRRARDGSRRPDDRPHRPDQVVRRH